MQKSSFWGKVIFLGGISFVLIKLAAEIFAEGITTGAVLKFLLIVVTGLVLFFTFMYFFLKGEKKL